MSLILLFSTMYALGVFIAWFILPKKLKRRKKVILCLLSWVIISYQSHKVDRQRVKEALANGKCPDCGRKPDGNCSDLACRTIL